MDTITARPELLKQANLSLIRKAMRTRKTATRAEIAKETGISSTTVRSLLCEMIENGELENLGHDASSGGRKAQRYGFKPDRYHSAVCCITGDQISGLLVNGFGEIVQTTKLQAHDGAFEPVITSFLDPLMRKWDVKAIGVGVPGIVEGNGYWRKSGPDQTMRKVEIGDALAKRYGVPVVLENDLNAAAAGFGVLREKKAPAEAAGPVNMVYLHFEQGCVSAGIIADGRLIRGSHHFAGELGLIPVEEGKLLDECITGAATDAAYAAIVAQAVSWICGILNPQDIVLCGPALRRECIEPVREELSARLCGQMSARMLYSPDVWQDYQAGMAHLTAAGMFDEVQIVKERPCL